MAAALIVFAVVIGLGVTIWVLVFGILLFVDFDRGMRMLGGLAMFVRSIKKKPAKETPRRHQRQGDEEQPREHKRQTPASPGTIRMFAQPDPRRRSGDNPKSSEPDA